MIGVDVNTIDRPIDRFIQFDFPTKVGTGVDHKRDEWSELVRTIDFSVIFDSPVRLSWRSAARDDVRNL